jgi:hypothetical protein
MTLLGDIIARLTSVIEEENRLLTEQREKSLDALILKKSQLLLELLRVQKSLAVTLPHPELAAGFQTLRAVMEANQRLLSIHLSAAKEISDTILDALRQNESDGTYGSRIALPGGLQ